MLLLPAPQCLMFVHYTNILSVYDKPFSSYGLSHSYLNHTHHDQRRNAYHLRIIAPFFLEDAFDTD